MVNSTASVIIPAHNEALTIGRCLETLLEDAHPSEFEIIVVCNGCDDETAEVASEFGHGVQVAEIQQASKTAAMNLGDELATSFPRVYLDADVLLATNDLRRVVKVLEDGPQLAAAPTLQMDLSRSSWPVRAYYKIWTATPYCREGMMGVGVTAVSEEGRKRFGKFPNIIADDGFARLHFAPHERCAIKGSHVVVRAPTSLSGLLKIKTRSRLGGYELSRNHADLARSQPNQIKTAAVQVLSKPWLWPSALVYLFVNIASRCRASIQLSNLDDYTWERDDTARSW